MAAGGFQHFTFDERRFLLQRSRLCLTKIVSRLVRHRLTIYCELGRNRYRDPDASRDSRRKMSGYYLVTAQDMVRARRQRNPRWTCGKGCCTPLTCSLQLRTWRDARKRVKEQYRASPQLLWWPLTNTYQSDSESNRSEVIKDLA